KLLEKILKERELKNKINAIEAFNARNIFSKDNEKAYAIAKKEKFSITGGSDAHTIFEIGSGKTIIKDFGIENLKKAILNGETYISGNKLSIICHLSSIYATLYKKLF
ncbi:MAG: PHP-associated domain-containing protein, partial [Candidatus Aenigmatarchaeota archaeon]